MNENTKYAGFWLRVVASMIDTIWIFGLLYIILRFVFNVEAFGADMFTQQVNNSVTRVAFEWIFPFAVVIAFWILKSSTPGKMLFKIKIVDAETLGEVSNVRMVVRYVAYFVSAIPLCLGFFWVGWDKKKQGWHDKIAKTVLIVETKT